MESEICVVIPAYNASLTIHEVITGALKHCSNVIVADDGSDDNTSAVAEKAGARIIKINQNRGKGNALKLLFRSASKQGYRAVISIDADGQHAPDSIPSFIEAHRKHPDAIIVGSRMDERNKIPRARLNAMKIANFYSSLASNQPLEDTQCGFRLYPLSVINKLQLTTERYVTETEILIKTGDAGGQIRFINIQTIYNDSGSHFRTVKDFYAITSYIIFYITFKWIIEGITPNKPDTYYPENIIDRLSKKRHLSVVLEIITGFTCLPIVFLFLLEYMLLSPFLNIFASVQRTGYGFTKITVATFMLPIALIITLINNLLNALGFQVRLVDKIIEIFYPEIR